MKEKNSAKIVIVMQKTKVPKERERDGERCDWRFFKLVSYRAPDNFGKLSSP